MDAPSNGRGVGSSTYDAFLSYSSRSDYQTARQIEGFLESFHKAASRTTNLRPLQICRDGSDFRIPGRCVPDTAVEDAVLERVKRELGNSRVLLVLCSPDAVRSDYMRQEIAFWLDQCPDRLILPLIMEATDPTKSPEECFPRALVEKRLHRAAIWYDLRAMRQSRRWPWEKRPANSFRNAEDELVRLAGDLLEWDSNSNGPIATIWEREQLRRKRWTAKVFMGVAAVFMVLASLAIYSAVRAGEQQKKARANAITIAADSSQDPLLASLLLAELENMPQPADGMRVARKLAALPVAASILPTSHPVIKAVLSPDERKVLAVSSDGRATLLAVDGIGNAVVFYSRSDPPTLVCDAPQQQYSGRDSSTDVAFSPDGSYFATASLDGRVRLWRAGRAVSGHDQSAQQPCSDGCFFA